jgi:hypothetical protein
LDAAFDAWYVYAHVYRANDLTAFAAVPFSEKGGYKAGPRRFDPQGLPLCAAGLPMPIKLPFTSQAVALGIERPDIRSGAVTANLNTLIHILITVRFLQRLRRKGSETAN